MDPSQRWSEVAMKTAADATSDAGRVVTAAPGWRLPLDRVDAVVFDLGTVLRDGRDSGARGYPDAVRLVSSLREVDVPAAVVTARRDGHAHLVAAGYEDLFAVVVDGADVGRHDLYGAPDPDLLMHAAGLLGAHPTRVAVVQDSAAGVQAGCRGGFGLVLGLDRAGGRGAELRAYGAEWVLIGLDGVTVDEKLARHRWWQRGPAPEPRAEYGGWLLDHTGVDPRVERIRETLCTVGNGYLASRGAAPEASAGGPHYPGTYVAGVFNRLRSRVHGHLHDDESLVNLPNWLVLSWRLDRGRWVVPEGPGISEYRQSLDLRGGVVHRRYRHVDDTGRATTVVSRMLVSMAAPHLAALETMFIAENWSGTLQLRSGIDGRVANRQVAQYAPLAGRHLRFEGQGRDGPGGLWLRTRTSQSRVEVGVATRTQVYAAGAPASVHRRATMATLRPEETYEIPVREGQPVRVHKVAAVHTSRDRAISEPVAAARQAAAEAGSFDDLLTAQVRTWRRLWERSHIELNTDGRAPLLALNLHTFHLLVATSPNVVDVDAGVGARGLHGEDYRGHVFWDELFVHRVLALHLPEASRALLLYRWRRLDAARRAAAAAGRRGAMFPWESGSDGREDTPDEVYNPHSRQWMPDYAGLQRHVGLAIGYSVWQYHQATADMDFLRSYGAELIVEISRFFADLAQQNPSTGRYEISGVVGPDEFHTAHAGAHLPGLANNAYTNVMTVWLLQRALEVVDLLACHDRAGLTDAIGINERELARWRDIATRMYVPFQDDGIISQFDGYPDLPEFDLAGYAARYGDLSRLDLILAAEGDSPNNYQVAKQADVLMLLYLLSAEELRDLLDGLGYRHSAPALLRTAQFYANRVVHGSSLSRVVHAWVTARTDRAASWRCFTEALSANIGDTRDGSTREGVHIGAMAGALDLAERCYLGVETRQEALWLNPRLPQPISRLHTLLTYRGHQIHVTATRSDLTLKASPCDAVPITVHPAGQQALEISGGQELTIPLKPAPAPPTE
jgi:trehalose/maltose hydrolase-like predicted phosphorylase/phosphoglycolate phosphatase-like HAD superfamily hydrolase